MESVDELCDNLVMINKSKKILSGEIIDNLEKDLKNSKKGNTFTSLNVYTIIFNFYIFNYWVRMNSKFI